MDHHVDIVGGGGDRCCHQWSSQEIHDFLVIRAELDSTFMETKRNKLLWDLVSTRMRQIGYSRSPQQCKSKWKSLINRYKGYETVEDEAMRQETFPFYNQMQIIFNARMQRLLWMEAKGRGGGDDGGAAAAASSSRMQTVLSMEAQGDAPVIDAGATATSSSRMQQAVVQISSTDEDEDDGNRIGGDQKKMRKKKSGDSPVTGNPIINVLKEIMGELMSQQMEMETQFVKAYEEREEMRRMREREWRQRMVALENERVMMIRWWREREEQRKMREEARAERRDALITALLNKISGEGLQ